MRRLIALAVLFSAVNVVPAAEPKVKIGDKVTVEEAALSKDGSPRAGATQNSKLVLSSGEKLPMR